MINDDTIIFCNWIKGISCFNSNNTHTYIIVTIGYINNIKDFNQRQRDIWKLKHGVQIIGMVKILVAIKNNLCFNTFEVISVESIINGTIFNIRIIVISGTVLNTDKKRIPMKDINNPTFPKIFPSKTYQPKTTKKMEDKTQPPIRYGLW